jgi:hypothetical protein
MSDIIRDTVICEPVRTPIGRYGGMFKSLTAVDLGVAALKGLLARTGLRPDDVEDVILGHCYPSMEAPAIGRVVALDAGLPVTVPGMQLDRRCGSGLQAVIQACMQVGTGQNDLVLAGGAESMSNVVFHSTDMRWGGARGGVKVHDGLNRGRTTAGGRDYPVPGGMIETAENLRRQYGIPREEQDELAVTSHRRAVAAQKEGLLADQIIPVTVTSRSAWGVPPLAGESGATGELHGSHGPTLTDRERRGYAFLQREALQTRDFMATVACDDGFRAQSQAWLTRAHRTEWRPSRSASTIRGRARRSSLMNCRSRSSRSCSRTVGGRMRASARRSACPRPPCVNASSVWSTPA